MIRTSRRNTLVNLVEKLDLSTCFHDLSNTSSTFFGQYFFAKYVVSKEKPRVVEKARKTRALATNQKKENPKVVNTATTRVGLKLAMKCP